MHSLEATQWGLRVCVSGPGREGWRDARDSHEVLRLGAVDWFSLLLKCTFLETKRILEWREGRKERKAERGSRRKQRHTGAVLPSNVLPQPKEADNWGKKTVGSLANSIPSSLIPTGISALAGIHLEFLTRSIGQYFPNRSAVLL